MHDGSWEPSDRCRPSPQLLKRCPRELLGSIMRSCRTPADMHQDGKRMFQKQKPHGPNIPRNETFNASWRSTEPCLLNFPLIFRSWKTKSALLYSSTYHFFYYWATCSLMVTGACPLLRRTLPRLGNITMRGSAERIYTTTYYIPSSPIEVRAYYPRVFTTQRNHDLIPRSHDPRII